MWVSSVTLSWPYCRLQGAEEPVTGNTVGPLGEVRIRTSPIGLTLTMPLAKGNREVGFGLGADFISRYAGG